DGRFLCDLGAIPAAEVEVDSPEAEVMLRPEALVLLPLGHKLAAGEAEVVRRQFYGHDQLVELRLDSGRTLRSRVWAGSTYKPGERVAVGVHGPAVVFPVGTSRDAAKT
nr:TOBE domain-containing protein [Actinomycetota bacterium]